MKLLLKVHMTSESKKIELALEEIRNMALPADEEVFEIDVYKNIDNWIVDAVIGPFARATQPGEPYASSCIIPSFDLIFSSEKEALVYARQVNDILIERGKSPTGPTEDLFEEATNF